MTQTLNDDLRSLLEQPGPFVSVYLNTEGASEDAPEELALRWRNMREEALGAGVSEKAMNALDALVDGAHRKGDGLVAFAGGDDVVLRRYLSRRVADSVTVGSTPASSDFWNGNRTTLATRWSCPTGREPRST